MIRISGLKWMPSVIEAQFKHDDASPWVIQWFKLEILPIYYGCACSMFLATIIHGAGGMVMVCPLFQRVLVQECRQENIPVIFYEVFAQCRRLGVQSAAELLKFYPDIVCSSKLLTGGSIPLSATLATEDVFEVFQGKSKVPAKALDLGEFITVVLNLSCIDCELQPSQGESGYASTSSKEIIKKSKEGWDLCKAIGECAIPYVWTFDTPENL